MVVKYLRCLILKSLNIVHFNKSKKTNMKCQFVYKSDKNEINDILKISLNNCIELKNLIRDILNRIEVV